MMQNSAATNPPRCPVCRSISDDAHGWLLTSDNAGAVAPVVWQAIKIHCCPECGTIYGALAS
jgi:rubredoxin